MLVVRWTTNILNLISSPEKYVYSYSAGIDFRLNIYPSAVRVNLYSAWINFNRHNLTIKIDPRAVRVNIFLMAVDVGIPVKRK